MTGAPLSLYIHIPFCSLKCSYCDFNSYAKLEPLIPPFLDALEREIALWSRPAAGRAIETVFFGGGTPSLLPLPGNVRILDAVRASFTLAPGAEITIEANPGTVDREYLEGLVAAGFTRVSFGVQSFDDHELAALDRIHTARDAVDCVLWARDAGFRHISVDLIYGLSGQTLWGWQSSVEQALVLDPGHLSAYALTVEDGTRLAYDVEHGRVAGPDPDLQADMYEWASERLAAAGYKQYEISNWARPGHECRHNLGYWRNAEWLGLGPGAHSHWADYRFANVYSPRQYIARVADAPPTASMDPGAVLGAIPHLAFAEEQTPDLLIADTAILALRLNDGLDVAAFERRSGRSFEALYGSACTELASLGLVERRNGRLRLTSRGRLLANEVFVRLLPA